MIQKLDTIKKQLSELAAVLNAFKSEAVQLRVLDFVLREESSEELDEKPANIHTSRRSRPRRTATLKKRTVQHLPHERSPQPVRVLLQH